MGKWVYRRPYFRQPRTRLPFTKRLHAWFLVHRRRAPVRRRTQVRRRRVFIFGVTAVVAGVGYVFRLKPRRAKRRVRARRRQITVLQHARPPANNLTGPVIRFRRAVSRIREAMIRRIRWRPKPVVPPTEPDERIEGSMKGRVFSSGLQRGRTVGGPV